MNLKRKDINHLRNIWIIFFLTEDFKCGGLNWVPKSETEVEDSEH